MCSVRCGVPKPETDIEDHVLRFSDTYNLMARRAALGLGVEAKRTATEFRNVEILRIFRRK